jgi:hypothetical protein
MNQQQTRTVETLNRLFAAERRSLLPRLAEAEAFFSWASAADVALLQRMIAEERDHLAWLAEALDRCCGALYPAGADVHTGHLHYLDLHAMLPQVIRGLESLVAVYLEAGKQPLIPPAAEVVNRILQNHQKHLAELRKLQARASTAPVG